MTEKKEEKKPLDLTTDEAIDFLFGEEAAEKLREEAHKGAPPPRGETGSRASGKSHARKHDNRRATLHQVDNHRTLVVRELTKSDARLFRAIRLRALVSDPDAFGETLESARAVPDSQWEAGLSRVIDSGGAIFVAEEGGDTVGMCAVGEDATDAGAAFVWGVFVAQEFRKAGVGSSLMRSAESWAAGRGYPLIRALVAAPNEGAVTFYKRLGYHIGPAAGALRPGSRIQVYPISKAPADDRTGPPPDRRGDSGPNHIS